MFICDQDQTVSFLKDDFIRRHDLPPPESIIGASLIQLLALIMGPHSNEDISRLKCLEKQIKQAGSENDIHSKISMNSLIYQTIFRKRKNGDIIGNIHKKTLKPAPSIQNNDFISTTKPSSSVLTAQPNSVQGASLNHLKNASAESPQPGQKRHGKGEGFPRILVVDDSVVNREVVDIYLSPNFPKLHFAENGEIAIDILKSTPIDLVLMDVHMPIMNGVEATLAIRESPKPISDVVIIALTADMQYQHKRVYKNVGMNDAISKPVRYDTLMQAIIRNWDSSTSKIEAA